MRTTDGIHARFGTLAAVVALAGCGGGDDSQVRRSPPPKGPLVWQANFEQGTFAEWSYTGEGEPQDWGHLAVVDPESQDVPSREGARVARFEVTPEDAESGRKHAKAYEYFHEGSGSDYRGWSFPNEISGTYRAWFYLPEDFSVQPGNWVNVFQFKDSYWTSEDRSEARSDPAWYVELKNAGQMGVRASRPDAPVAVLKHWQDWERYEGGNYPGKRVAVPLGRWFEMRFDLYEEDRVELYVDGSLVTTGRHSDFPVGRGHDLSNFWIFGVGHYASAPGALFVDDVTYNRFGAPAT